MNIWKTLASKLRRERNVWRDSAVPALQERIDKLRESKDILDDIVKAAGLDPAVDFVAGLFNDPVTGNPVVTEMAASSLARMFWPILDQTRAANFVEMSFGKDERQLLITIQRRDGRRPSDLLKEAQRERDDERAARIECERRIQELTDSLCSFR